MSDTQEDFLTVKDVAKRLKVGPEAVRSYIKLGQLTAKKFGKSFRITEAAYQEYIKK